MERGIEKKRQRFSEKAAALFGKNGSAFRPFVRGKGGQRGFCCRLAGGLLCLCLVVVAAGCSTTRNLPEDEVLYTGVKKIQVLDTDKEVLRLADDALTEAKAAISVAPNNSLFGSASLRSPLPVGLWVYNSFAKYKKGVGRWIFRHFAADPVFLSSVNPEVRAKVATNLLHDYGFFRGAVDFDTLPAGDRKAKLSYEISLGLPYYIDTIMYRSFSPGIDSLLRKTQGESYLRQGDLFSVENVQQERKRIQTLLRNRGYYFFESSALQFEADTVHGPGRISLRISPVPGLARRVRTPWRIGRRSVNLYHYAGEPLTDTIHYEDLTIRYNRTFDLRRAVILSNFRLPPGELYTEWRHDLTSLRFSRLNMFQTLNIGYRADSVGENLLDVTVEGVYDAPYDVTFESDFTMKSNSQLGPGAALTITRKNIFDGGEALSLKLEGSYEWQTRRTSPASDESLINSWEMGASLSLSFPRLLLPGESARERRFTQSTDLKLSFTRYTRANYFRMLSFGGEIAYQYQSSPVLKHTITPFSLTFNAIRASTATFDSIRAANPVLDLSLRNQFIPAMKYSVTFDNSGTRHRNKLWWQLNFSSAGNLTSLAYRGFGKKFDEEKQLLGASFAQFLKFSAEGRYNLKINNAQNLVFRLYSGIIYSYGNSRVAPYSEQFYIGGANSLRAFTIRSIGPGAYTPDPDNEYSYMDQAGDLKFEANVEYRFRLFGSLHGAAFADAGNVWLLRDDPTRPNATLDFSRFWKDLALDVGVGLRYDLDFLVLRLDVGYGLHAPYHTGHSGYFNIPKFKDAVGLQLAIGYPF